MSWAFREVGQPELLEYRLTLFRVLVGRLPHMPSTGDFSPNTTDMMSKKISRLLARFFNRG